MKTRRFEIALAGALLLAFAAFCWWQAPGSGGKLTRQEVDAYLRVIEPRMPMPPEEKAEALARLRAWGEADDGEPVHMLNLMRYFDRLQPLPGMQSFKGTPEQANAHYEAATLPILERLGGYPLLGGEVAGVRSRDGRQHSNLMAYDRDVDDWSRVLVVRYPGRRAFFELLANPAYLDVMPYKLASLKVALVPVRAEVVIPELRWFVGAVLLALFLAVGWLRATRRRG
jgi:hypothetical protein